MNYLISGCTFSYYPFCRKLKTSLRGHVYLASHETLSTHWKENILVPIQNIYQEENSEIQCGVMFDPSVFIPHYLKRFLMRQDREGKPLSPGNYKIVMKVHILIFHCPP